MRRSPFALVALLLAAGCGRIEPHVETAETPAIPQPAVIQQSAGGRPVPVIPRNAPVAAPRAIPAPPASAPTRETPFVPPAPGDDFVPPPPAPAPESARRTQPERPVVIREHEGMPKGNEAVRLHRRIKAEMARPAAERTMTPDEIQVALDRQQRLLEESEAEGETPRPRGTH